jgi:hypothetical protein
MGHAGLQADLNPAPIAAGVGEGLDDGHTAAIDLKRSDAGGHRMAREVDDEAGRSIVASNGRAEGTLGLECDKGVIL